MTKPHIPSNAHARLKAKFGRGIFTRIAEQLPHPDGKPLSRQHVTRVAQDEGRSSRRVAAEIKRALSMKEYP